MTETVAISAVIIACDAARYLPAVLDGLAVCDDIVVVDSGSSDDTVAIAEAKGARVIHHEWEGYGPQKRFAVAQAQHDWVLSIDADEVLDAEAQQALRQLSLNDSSCCWQVSRRTFVGQREIKYGHWHPDRPVRLFHREATNFTDAPIHESVPATASTKVLAGSVLHYSYTDLAAIFRMDFHKLKAERYRGKGRRAGGAGLCLRAITAFTKSYVLKRGFLDGGAGVVVALSASVNAVLGLAMASDSQAATES